MLIAQFLKNLFASVIPKQLTPRGRHRGKGGSPIGSSLPRHGVRIKTETQNRTNKNIKKKSRADCKFAKKKGQKSI